jgi:hypothetical protein
MENYLESYEKNGYLVVRNCIDAEGRKLYLIPYLIC